MISKTFTTSILALCMAILFSTTSFAQSNYLAGYLINNNLDTLKGLIDYRNWERNPTAISFKTSDGDIEKYYLPTDIKEFVVADEIYVSAIVDIMTLDNFSGVLQYDAAIKTKKDTVFLQSLVIGDKDLLFLKDRDGIEQFYMQTDTSLMLLKYKKYLVEKDGGKAYAENKSFAGQLVYTFRDCADIRDKTRSLEYNKSNLTKLFVEYHKCTNQTIDFEKKKDKGGIKITALAGLSHYSVEIVSDNYYLEEVPFTPSTNFAAGICFDFILSRNLGKWSIAEELLYTSFETGGHYDDVLNPATIEIAIDQLKINNMARYRTPAGKFNILANAGISLAFGLHSVNIRHDESIFHPPADGPAIGIIRSGEVGFIIGTGLSYKAYSLQIRYETSNGFSGIRDVGTPTKRWYVLAGYTF